MEKIKILYIVKNMKTDTGVATVIMNYYNKIDKEKFKIDFFIITEFKDSYGEFLKQNGSEVYYAKNKYSLKNIKKMRQEFSDFLKKNKYDIIELHSTNFSYIFIHEAKKINIPIRIVHSHSTVHSANKFKNFVNICLNKDMKKDANIFFACSEKSGQYWYNKKICNSNSYYIIKNGIEMDKFIYKHNWENKLKREYNLEGYTVVGFVGRISKEKNIKFLNKIMNNVISKNRNFKFVIIGDGKELENLKKNTYKYKDNIIFLGMRKDVNKILNCIDLLLLPSKREGLPMTIVEAQALNVECYISNTITKEVDMGGTKFIKLNVRTWVKEILNYTNRKERLIIDRDKFDINICVKNLERIYTNLYKNFVGERYDI